MNNKEIIKSSQEEKKENIKIQAQKENIKIQTQKELNNLKKEILQKKIDISPKKEKLRQLIIPLSPFLNQEVNEIDLDNLGKTIMWIQEKIEDFLYTKFNIKDWYINRLLFLLLVTGLSNELSYNFSIVAHEYSHGKTAKLLWWYNISYGRDNKKGKKLYQLFLHGLLNPFSHQYVTNFNYRNNWDISYIDWAWLNMQEWIAETINKENIINGSQTSLSKDITYLRNKAAPLNYSLFAKDSDKNDISSYIKELNKKWISIKKSSLIKYQALSLLLSWGTINALKNMYNFITTWERENKILNLTTINGYKVSLPELNTFMNSKNFSVEILEYIYNKTLVYELWLEKPIIGKGKLTYTLWINKKTLTWDLYTWKISTNWESSFINLKIRKNLNKKGNSIEIETRNVIWNKKDWTNRPDKNFWENSIGISYIIKF